MAEYTYQPSVIEPKWQEVWAERRTFRTPSDPEELRSKPKYYVLDMFPYPSGAGLHVGHPEGYTATDVVARFKDKGISQCHLVVGIQYFAPLLHGHEIYSDIGATQCRGDLRFKSGKRCLRHGHRHNHFDSLQYRLLPRVTKLTRATEYIFN